MNRRPFLANPHFSQTFSAEVAHALVRAASALMPTPCLDSLSVPTRVSRRSRANARLDRLTIGPQVNNLPHVGSYSSRWRSRGNWDRPPGRS